MTRVTTLPWTCLLLTCAHHALPVYAWRGRVWCRCQMSRADRQALADDMRLDLEERIQGENE